jgi:hypothetical protein
VKGSAEDEPTENTHRVAAAMKPLDELSRKKIEERRREVAEGKRFDSRDLLSLMRTWTVLGSAHGSEGEHATRCDTRVAAPRLGDLGAAGDFCLCWFRYHCVSRFTSDPDPG